MGADTYLSIKLYAFSFDLPLKTLVFENNNSAISSLEVSRISSLEMLNFDDILAIESEMDPNHPILDFLGSQKYF